VAETSSVAVEDAAMDRADIADDAQGGTRPAARRASRREGGSDDEMAAAGRRTGRREENAEASTLASGPVMYSSAPA